MEWRVDKDSSTSSKIIPPPQSRLTKEIPTIYIGIVTMPLHFV